MPESIETYPGTRGNTQGDRKETSPARNTAKIDRFTQLLPVALDAANDSKGYEPRTKPANLSQSLDSCPLYLKRGVVENRWRCDSHGCADTWLKTTISI